MMTNEEYKVEFQKLKDNLFENFAVYHERVTLFIQLTAFEIDETSVHFKCKIIKPLNRIHAEKNRLYQNMIAKNEITFGASYQFRNDETDSLLNNNKIGRVYCSFTLWLDPELSKFIYENEDAITKQIPDYILWDKEWRNLRS